MSAIVSAAGALVWMTHALLQERAWAARSPETGTSRLESFAGDVNLLPARRYQLPTTGGEDADVHVRALLVGSKLFVHFVSSAMSVQLSLKVPEFVKPRGQQTEPGEGERGHVLYTDKWRCNMEILRWRLERNLFPEFSSDVSLVASAAELSRLPEPLLTRVGGFLSVPDFCRVTRTNKYLHQIQDSSEMWQQFLLRDFPTLHSGRDPKALYISHWTYQKRMEAWSQHGRSRRLREYVVHQQGRWRWRSDGRLPAPPLHLPMPPPFLPLGEGPWSLRPPHHPGLLGDDDFEMLQDPFGFCLDPLYPYFY
ncbi:hypothetical protein PHYPSEUDO_006694 [Phytophthora pseudosyringae]|uniref:F-box domain-containing protein n=1 Tax=Phytophthora pseudosyringae TaxID=221518 RepID=A0A8T1VII2_9STRA|nr:hypothetical protein PHYPSEUDO_006694 [Phytophthora pseudosyringae]